MRLHLRISSIDDHPKGKLYLSARVIPYGVEVTTTCKGVIGRSTDFVWNMNVNNDENSALEIIARRKKPFNNVQEFGRILIPLMIIRDNSMLKDWFPIRCAYKAPRKPMLIELELHKNTSLSPTFSPPPLSLITQVSGVMEDLFLTPKQLPPSTPSRPTRTVMLQYTPPSAGGVQGRSLLPPPSPGDRYFPTADAAVDDSSDILRM